MIVMISKETIQKLVDGLYKTCWIDSLEAYATIEGTFFDSENRLFVKTNRGAFGVLDCSRFCL
jgi:hypothetical protein